MVHHYFGFEGRGWGMVVQSLEGLCRCLDLLVSKTLFNKRTSAPAMLLSGGYCAFYDMVMRMLVRQSAYLWGDFF